MQPGHLLEPFGISALLLLAMPKVYITGQDRVEVFWRTMITNVDITRKYPTAEEKGQILWPAVDDALLPFLGAIQYEGDTEYKSTMRNLRTFLVWGYTTPEAAALVPSFREILQMKTFMPTSTRPQRIMLCRKQALLPETTKTPDWRRRSRGCFA